MSKKKDDTLYVEHILECISDIGRYVGNNQKLFMENDMARNATLRQLQIMSESCTRLSKDLRSSVSGIDWVKIAGFRNILVHDYTGDLDFTMVWDVITKNLPELKKVMLGILQQGK